MKLIFTLVPLLLFGCTTPSSTTVPRLADGIYLCSDCDLKYTDQAMAQKCYDWCTTEHSCNAEITQHAVGNVSNH
jgi:ribosomal protein L37AE/L43A